MYDTTAANVESGIVAADGSLVLKLYFKLNQADVTVNYYWNETTDKVATSKTLYAQTVGSVITTEKPITIEGYTALPNQTCNLTVGVDASNNVINFYYYKNVELTANSKTETYDGTEKSVSGFTSKVALDSSDVTLTFTPAITVGAKGTNVGTYPASFAEGTVGTVDTTEKYIVTKATPGKLTIKPAEVTVTIKGNTKTETYAGTEYTVTGYTVESISNNLYKEEYFALKTDAKVEAKGTNAGDYMMGLTAGSFANSNTNFEVTFVVEDGKLTIAKRDVTVTGESATKVYNGQTQEINGYTVDNLVKGHEMTGVTYSAKGKDPGKYDGSFIDDHKIVDASVEDVTANYNVKTVIGALTITQPSRPTRPSTPTKDVTSVKTADGSQMTLWMSMMLASAAGIVFLGKKRKEEQ